MKLSEALIRLNEKEEYPCYGRMLGKTFNNPFSGSNYLRIDLNCLISSEAEWKKLNDYAKEDDFKVTLEKVLKKYGIDKRQLYHLNEDDFVAVSGKCKTESKELVPKRSDNIIKLYNQSRIESFGEFYRITGFDKSKTIVQKFLEKFITDKIEESKKNLFERVFKKFDAKDSKEFRSRWNTFPGSNVPERVEVYKQGSNVMIAMIFKWQSEDYAKKYLKNFAFSHGLMLKNISSHQEGDYHDDFVSSVAPVVLSLW